MIKPERLRKGDKVAVVSLSRGMLGEDEFIHILDLAKSRLENEYGLSVVVAENALKGLDYLYRHPEKRAEDLMNVFRDKSVKAVINAIGGDDTIRLLPYIDLDVIRDNPKIFMGFSDTTTNHFMMYKAGLVSYYGGSLMNNWAEYGGINPYTKEALINAFFEPKPSFPIKPCEYCSFCEDLVLFNVNSQSVQRHTEPDTHGYELLGGSGRVQGELLGGCAEVFPELMGTSLWPRDAEWDGKILFLEVSDEEKNTDITLDYFVWILRGLAAQGVFNRIAGVIMGKPPVREKYEAYKTALCKVIRDEEGKTDLPIIYNVNFGHAYPIGIIPRGLPCEIDCEKKTITVTESFTR